MQVDEVVTAYTQAIADEDRVRASRLLESLEGDHYANEPDWERIRVFCVAQGFDARLEIITKLLIKRGGAASGAPFLTLAGLLVKSGRVAEAKRLVTQYRSLTDNLPGGNWELVNLLFQIEAYADCLEVITQFLALNAPEFGYLMMEARTYWYLNDRKRAKKKHRELSKYLGNDAGRWLWYSTSALELNEAALAGETVRKLIRMLDAGSAKLSKDVVFALREVGHEADLRRIISKSDPKHYSALEEYLVVFEAALDFGFHKSALEFGKAILEVAPDHELRRQIETLARGPLFLMSS